MTDFLTKPHFAQLAFMMRGTLQDAGHLSIGSLFSGWGVLEMTVRELERQWNEVYRHEPLHANLKFLCEKNKRKQAYLRTRFPGIPIFQDVADLAKRKAPTTDGSACDVPEARKINGQIEFMIIFGYFKLNVTNACFMIGFPGSLPKKGSTDAE